MAEAKKTVHKVRLKNVRLSFPKLFKADITTYDDGNTSKKFKAAFLIDKKKQAALIEEIEDAIEDAMAEKWGKSIPKLKAEKLCLRDGDQEEWDGYEGMMYVSASNTKKPPIVDRDKTPLTEEDGRPYAGCYVNATIHIWVQDKPADKGGKRVNASLEAVQFVKDGEAFGAGAVDIDEEFEDLGGDDDDDRPARRRRPKDEDDDRPARRRPKDEDDDEPAPRRRRAAKDEDDDEPPARRRRPKDEDDDEPAPRRRAAKDEDDERPARRRRSNPMDDDDENPF